jgi:selenocysteine-specific elongation factor
VIARLTLRDPLPLHVGDRVLLRDPGRLGADGHPSVVGATMLDVAPPPLGGRGAAAAAAAQLATWPDVGRRPLTCCAGTACCGPRDLRRWACTDQPAPVAGEWLADPVHWLSLKRRLAEAVSAHAAADPLAPGLPAEAARAAIGVPDRAWSRRWPGRRSCSATA